jgi:hypothetical protein
MIVYGGTPTILGFSPPLWKFLSLTRCILATPFSTGFPFLTLFFETIYHCINCPKIK